MVSLSCLAILLQFSADKTYVGSQFGGFAGYQVNSWIGIEASARTGYTRIGGEILRG